LGLNNKGIAIPNWWNVFNCADGRWDSWSI
jgi:hypothetical protein